jgi:hypothetical protein
MNHADLAILSALSFGYEAASVLYADDSIIWG